MGGKRVTPVAPEYKIWAGIKRRCHNPKSPAYARYGGRGIELCPEWRDSYAAFLAHVGPRPSRAHSIDRIDNDGHYAPGNVRWATVREQMRNASTNRWIEFRGERLCMEDWAARVGVTAAAMHRRLRDWSLEDALTRPPILGDKQVEFRGKTQSIAAWARELGINELTLAKRLRAGWSVERALTAPIRRIAINERARRRGAARAAALAIAANARRVA